MGGNARQRPSEPGRPLTIRAIVLGGVFVGLVGAGAVVALLYFYGGGTDRDRVGLDVVRTAGTLVVGAGGAILLLLTARRQRSTELTLEHQRQVAAAAERDAAEQRVTELYTHAVDQLGNDKAPVRLGGLHALERLAQNNPDQRQTIVDVICAYLRMPYTPPEDTPPADDAPAEAHARYENRRQELQVRLTAQRILAAHFQPDAADAFWDEIVELDLSEAHLYRLDLSGCHIQNAQFDRAQFSGYAGFNRARFSGDVVFNGAQFSGDAWFGGARFSGNVEFDGARFSRGAVFGGAQFNGYAVFGGAQFNGYAVFGGAQFSGNAVFGGAQFSGYTVFGGARVRPHCSQLWPAGWTTRGARTTEGEEEGWMYLVPVDDSIE
jgi:Pentapeptide repeats (9 copies)/Pentapeptide repeats (8 copies)